MTHLPGADVALTVRLATVPVLISAAELLSRRAAIGPGGLLDYDVAGLLAGAVGLGSGPRSRAAHWLLDATTYRWVLVVQMALAIAVLCRPRSVGLVAVLLGLHLLFLKRHHLSKDGSDAMVATVLGVTTMMLVDPSRVVAVGWAAFLAGQLALAYLVSGMSKAQSDAWWQGWAIAGVLGTRIFGHPTAARVSGRHLKLTVTLTRLTFVLEALIPAAFFAPRPVLLSALAVGLSFHLGCAVAMGLNTFAWAFAACYPATLWLSRVVNGSLGPTWRAGLSLLWVATVGSILVALYQNHRTEPVPAAC